MPSSIKFMLSSLDALMAFITPGYVLARPYGFIVIVVILRSSIH